MTFFTADDIGALRSVELTAHPTTITISTPGAPVADGAGGFTPGTPTTVNVEARIVERSGLERLDNDRLAEIGRYELRLPAATTISATSTVTAGGRSYRVVFTPAVDSLEALRSVGLEEVA